jgi:PucR family transcriptional regulator, purine catabolism regulatory protein
MPLVTVADIAHGVVEPLAGALVVLGGAAGLEAEVTWPTMARPGSPIFPAIKPHEIALASAPALGLLDPPASLPLLIGGLAERGAAGLILRGPVSGAERDAAIRAADTHGLPLLLVGEDVALHDIERGVTALVRERRDEFYTRTTHLQEIQFQLADSSGRHAGLDTLVGALATLTRAPAALTGPPPGLAVRQIAPAAGGDLPTLWAGHAARALAVWQAPGALVGVRAADPPVLALETAGGRVLLAAPVLARERLVAALLLLASGPAAEIDKLTLARAAGVAALDLARSQAVAVAETRTEQRLRGEFIADLLNHAGGSGDDMLRARARGLGLEIAPAYAVALLSIAPPDATTAREDAEARVEAVARALAGPGRATSALAQPLGARLALLWPLSAREATGADGREAPAAFTRVIEEARLGLARGSAVTAAAGVGRVYGGPGGAARSRQEAEQALWSAWRLYGGGRACAYGDLGVYRLLLPLRGGHQTELRAFYDETLGALGDGAGPNGKLIETLDAFLAHGGAHSETAGALALHRNTLSYRLRRISEITGLDLDDPAVRFRAQVALSVRRLL